jgi:lipid-A-disaccharide synthase
MKIFISAGDISGEMHAATLAAAIKKIAPNATISAFGGARLKASSDEFLFNLTELSAFGFWEPVKQYFVLRKVFREFIIGRWNASRPDKVILVDYYGFNIHIAEEAKRRGIPVYYYISPQVWASRAGRIKKIARFVKKMLVILPFEEEIYKKAGVDAVFVGHPLLDTVPQAGQGAAGGKQVIGLFPGSRPSVIAKHLPIFKETVKLIEKEISCEFLMFSSRNAEPPLSLPGIRTVVEDDFSERRKLDFAITVSGTVSLETALLGIPMAVMFRLSRFNYMLAKLIVKVPYITMANILLDRPAIPELIQNDANPEKISTTVLQMLNNPGRLDKMKADLSLLRGMLGKPGVSERAANIILND